MVVAYSTGKDFEIHSWNGQGEITRIEGMFIIDFLLFLPCSHMDSKPINLIMKIHYMINMPDSFIRDSYRDRHTDYKFAYQSLKMHFDEIKSQLDEIKEYVKSNTDSHEISKPFELKKTIKNILNENKKLRAENKKLTFEIQKLNDKINQLTDRVSELEVTISQKNKAITTFEKHNVLMSELLDERKSGWILRRDLAIRTNPVPGEPNEFGYPLNFNEENVHNLHSNEKNHKWCHFKYYSEKGISEVKEYDMPWALYEFLSGRLSEKEAKQKIFDIHELQNEDKITEYIVSKGGSLRGTYPTKVIKFINKTRGKSFEINEFDRYCGFKDNRESRRQYIKKLIDWGLIGRTGNKRVYKNLI